MIFQLEIQPFDTLFFRDGKPFDMAEETIANVKFPPSPMTIHRAIVSLILSQNQNQVSLSKAEQLVKSIKIKDVFLLKENEFLYKIPLDVLIDEDDKIAYSSNLSNANLIYNTHIKKILTLEEEKILKSKDVYISKIDLEDYLNNAEKIYYEDNLIYIEYKIGIGLNRQTNTVEESKLYRIPLIRLKDKVSIFVKFEVDIDKFPNINLQEEGYIKLGGENKVSYYKVITNINTNIEVNTTSFNGVFKLYLKTPAIFKNGYLADWIPKGEYKDLKLEFLSALVGRYKTISGFDMKNNKIKNTYRAVPEGSVYYFRTQETDFRKIQAIFEQDSISDFYKNEGFGLVYVGVAKERE